MRFEALLGRTVRGFWATSYSFDLKLFDQYLLRRLAESPLNAVVLVDHDKLAAVWEQLRDGQGYLARQVGRRYLLRGVRLAGGGAFHPKTYLFARADHASLIVGSGNLTRPGIDYGREAFVDFTTQREEDLPSMRSWALWMGRLVQSREDEMLLARWTALREASPWMLGPTEGSQFLSNDVRSIRDQLAERLPSSVRELHVTAPYFDEQARALRSLLDLCDPQHLTLYVGAGVNVDGPALAGVLGAARSVRVRRFEPRTFVHAKLIGVVGTDGRGVVLSGSANLSRAALDLTYGGTGRGNCEAAVVRAGSAEQVRRLFEGSGLELVDEPLDWLTGLEFDDDHPTLGRPIVLRTAAWRKDGRIDLAWHGAEETPDLRLGWDGTRDLAEIDAAGVTVEALDAREPQPLLVFLADPAGEPISNRVVIDDPAALNETLRGSSRKRSSRPSELAGLDMVPLVRLVLWAHDKFIFDPDQTGAFRRAEDAAGEAASAEEATDFWERYANEELQYDPRTQSYKPLTIRGASAEPVDELLRELQMLLHAAPDAPRHPFLRVLTLGGDDDDNGGDGTRGTGTPWTMEARQRVRAYHLLMRWSTAVSDPRHALVAPAAPAVNYQILLGIVLLAWTHEALEFKQLRKLLLALLDGFIGRGNGQGYLGRIDAEQRASAVARLDPDFVEIGAGLACLAIAVPGWQDDIYDWQPALQRGIENGVLLPGPLSTSVIEHLTDDTVTVAEIEEFLINRAGWADDATWCKRLAAELGLDFIALDRFSPPAVPIVAMVRESPDPLHDNRLLTIARRVVDFKHVNAVAVRSGTATFVFEPGKYARALVDGRTYQTAEPVAAARVKEVEAQGGSWADVLGIPGRQAVA